MKNDTIKMYALLLIILCAGLLSASLCHGQTNGWALPAPGQQQETTAQDIAKVFSDFGIHVNLSGIGGTLFLLYYIVKLARNKTSLGNGAIGQFLSSVVNAETSAPPKPVSTVVPQPQQPPKP